MSDLGELPDTELEPFTERELGLIASLVREKIRKRERNQRTDKTKWGAEYDPTQHDRRVAVLESIYRKTGRDPENITNRPRVDPDDEPGQPDERDQPVQPR